MWRSETFFVKSFGIEEEEYSETRRALARVANIQPAPAGTIAARVADALPAPPERCVFAFTTAEMSGGTFSEPSIADLRRALLGLLEDPAVRAAVDKAKPQAGRPTIRVGNLVGESRSLHAEPRFANAVIQSASQFNYLEFPSPRATPEMGIGAYEFDRTQGPACAMACAAGTAYRNYLLAPLRAKPNLERGQQRDNQRNGLGDLERALLRRLRGNPEALAVGDSGDMMARQPTAEIVASTEPGSPLAMRAEAADSATNGVKLPWRVKSGYIEAAPEKLEAANALLRMPEVRDELRDLLRLGLHEEVDVVVGRRVPHTVSQVYCSAISCGYSRCGNRTWAPTATLVLEALYEGTLLIAAYKAAAAIAAGRPPPPLLLTKVGGGVFGNEAVWIQSAIRRAVSRVAEHGVPFDALVVHYGAVEDGYEDRVVASWSR